MGMLILIRCVAVVAINITFTAISVRLQLHCPAENGIVIGTNAEIAVPWGGFVQFRFWHCKLRP